LSVLTHLNNTSSALVLTETEKSSISTSLTTLSSRLNAYFGTQMISSFHFGSYSRGTILPRKADSYSDVDYMVVFSTSDGEKKPQTYLDRLKNFANAKYSTSEVVQSYPTIVLNLNHIRFELVPAVKDYFGDYKIPNPNDNWSDWIYTYPLKDNEALTEKNKNNNYEIKPLVRLIKYWNAKNGYPYSSFALESYIVGNSYWLCTSLKDYFYNFWDNFEAHYSNPQATKDKVTRAKKIVANAKSYEASGYPVTAEQEIEKLIPKL
jgi:predicted nucleotidyltransferase